MVTAKSTPDSQRGVLFGCATSAKSCGWFLSSIASGVIAMQFGVRWVFFSAAVVFLALVPVIKAITRWNARSRPQCA